MKLVFEPVARPAGSLAERIARLDHEVGNHAVEDRAVEVRSARLRSARARVGPFLRARREADEVPHRLRGALLFEADDDVAHDVTRRA